MKKLLILSLTLIPSIAMASELNVPNQFEDGQVTSAEQMNANFEAIQAAVNDNHARIESMQQPTKAIFQGFSTDSMDGEQGLIAMQQACHNFVPGSHICNTTEFAESPYNAEAAATMEDWSAWLLIEAVGGNFIQDKSGMMVTSTSISCNGWRSGYGAYVDWAGKITYTNCTAIKKIACCM